MLFQPWDKADAVWEELGQRMVPVSVPGGWGSLVSPDSRLGKSWSQADSKPHAEERAAQSQIPEISGSHESRGEYQGWRKALLPLWVQSPCGSHGIPGGSTHAGHADELSKSRTFIDSKGELKTKTAKKEATTHN